MQHFLIPQAQTKHSEHCCQLHDSGGDTPQDMVMGNMAKLMINHGQNFIGGLLSDQRIEEHHFPKAAETTDECVRVRWAFRAINHLDLWDGDFGFLSLFEDLSFQVTIFQISEREKEGHYDCRHQKLKNQND